MLMVRGWWGVEGNRSNTTSRTPGHTHAWATCVQVGACASVTRAGAYLTRVLTGVQMHVCNGERYGFLPVPLKPQQTLQEEEENCAHTIAEAMSE